MSNELSSVEEPSNTNTNESFKAETKTEKTFARYRSLLVTECGLKVTTEEAVQKRLQNLRKELTYINETDWLFEPSDRKSLFQ